MRSPDLVTSEDRRGQCGPVPGPSGTPNRPKTHSANNVAAVAHGQVGQTVARPVAAEAEDCAW